MTTDPRDGAAPAPRRQRAARTARGAAARASWLHLTLALLALTGIAVYTVLWLKVPDALQRGTDFSASYVAALLLREGHAALLYDQGVEAARHASILLPGYHVNLPFITPPATALLTLPLTWLGPDGAYRVFSALQLLLLAGAVGVAARAAPWPGATRTPRLVTALMGVAGTATLALLLLGQWDGVCALGLALAYAAWRRDRSVAAGIWIALGFGIAKPHLALGLLAYAIGRRDWRAVGGMAAGATVLAAASVAGVGPAATAGFVGANLFALGHTPAASTLGLLGLASSWLGTGPLPAGIALGGGILCLLGAGALGEHSRAGRARLETTLAAAAALSLVLSPHLLAYDLVILAPAMVWVGGRAAALDTGQPWPGRHAAAVIAGWLALAVLVVIDAGASAPAPPGRLVPWGLLAASAALAAPGSRNRPARGSVLMAAPPSRQAAPAPRTAAPPRPR